MPLTPTRDAAPRPKSLAKEVKFAANQAILSGVRTIVPGMVNEYDAASKRAVVQLVVKQSFIDGTSKPSSPLIDVPVVQPSTGGYMVHLQINEGDIVAVAFTNTGLATFKRAWGSSSTVEPVPASAFVDAIAFPWGMHDIQPVSNEGIVLQSRDGRTYFHLKDDLIEMRAGSRYFRMGGGIGSYG